MIRSLELFLNWLWNRLYDGIRLYNLDHLTQVARDHEVIYVPCHRSHIDYLLLSFVVTATAWCRRTSPPAST